MRKGLLAVAVISALVPSAGRADPVAVPHVVVGDEVISGGTFVVTYPIVVPPGASLTIRDATVFLDWRPDPACFHGTAGYCQSGLMVNGGTLRVLDSTIDAHDWDAGDGNSGWNITGYAATFDYERSRFIHGKGFGTQLAGVARSKIIDSTFEKINSAVVFWRGAEADIVHNEFRDVVYGIQIRDTSSVIARNHFTDIGGRESFGRALDIQETIIGEKHFVTMPVVEDNVVENSREGMLNLNGFPNIVRRNVFRNNVVGAAIGLVGIDNAHRDPPVWTGNMLDGNDVQLAVAVSGGPSGSNVLTLSLAFHGNSFLNTVCNDIIANPAPARVTLEVNASNNWWGTPSGPVASHGPDCPAFVGSNIVVEPWLTEAP